jgi:hypothetical protein
MIHDSDKTDNNDKLTRPRTCSSIFPSYFNLFLTSSLTHCAAELMATPERSLERSDGGNWQIEEGQDDEEEDIGPEETLGRVLFMFLGHFFDFFRDEVL